VAPVYPQPAASQPQPAVAVAAPPPTAAVPPPVAQTVPGQHNDRAAEKPNCIGGGFCIGPMLTAGLINVIGLGAHARTDHWGFGFDYQFIGLGYEDVDGDLSLVTIEGRVYPFGNAFYLSAGIAWQHVTLETTVRVPEMQGLPAFDIDADGTVNLSLLKLGLGFMGREGLVFGIDLGFGVRLNRVSVELRTNLPRIAEVIEAENEFRRAAKAWIEWLPFTPQLNLVRVGYLF
jgi:hypothetical protein